ncbi:uncharacterized protein EDB91DRAFT_1080329 [Suillus paluster]|uniref:uncharacterized protein n=1 Tax=Suillus paluster TaxID=48578 RepID=UPI001B88653C|nr:uncharacterized protein EDB91DRAFT_1080329 [Suillus paluster]KAG1745410.1 hypothetical protein EDB91DRAFT_1080329 [Suillus paluster]
MQASRVQSSLQGIMKNISDKTTHINAALTFYHDPIVAGLFSGSKKFYIVVIGHESGIFLSWHIIWVMLPISQVHALLPYKVSRFKVSLDNEFHQTLHLKVLMRAIRLTFIFHCHPPKIPHVLEEYLPMPQYLHQRLFTSTYAHGYTLKALLHIAHAHDMSSSCQEFVMAIAAKGMPMAEAVFLWGLIAADGVDE